MTESRKLVAPKIDLNTDARIDLGTALEDAFVALSKAGELLAQVTPLPDTYEPGKLDEALTQHIERLRNVNHVANEVDSILSALLTSRTAVEVDEEGKPTLRKRWATDMTDDDDDRPDRLRWQVLRESTKYDGPFWSLAATKNYARSMARSYHRDRWRIRNTETQEIEFECRCLGPAETTGDKPK